MDCHDAKILIPLRIDGAINNDQDTSLEKHLRGCAACTRELRLQERISGALREIGREEIQAPPQLCSMVMGKLQVQPKLAFPWLPAAWRKGVAAAAAILLIAGGSAGVTAGLKMAGGGKMIGYGTTAPTQANGGDTTRQGELVQTPGGNPTGEVGKEIDSNIVGTNTISLNNSGSADGNLLSGADIGVNTLTNTAGTLVPDGPKVLLSSGMKVTSTILKVAVDDLTDARARAVSLAAGTEAGIQVFPEQNSGKRIVVIRLTVMSDRVPELIAGLTGIGTFIDRQDESRDITSFYNETLVQYNDLQSRISSAGDAGERSQIEAQLASYKQQLDNMNTEAGRQVIILWLEGH